MVTGKVPKLDEVVKPVIMAGQNCLKKLNGFRLAKKASKKP